MISYDTLRHIKTSAFVDARVHTHTHLHTHFYFDFFRECSLPQFALLEEGPGGWSSLDSFPWTTLGQCGGTP